MTVSTTAPLTDIDASKLTIELSPTAQANPVTTGPFGAAFTDHMLTVDYVPGEGWGAPRIHPFANLDLHPATPVLHYGVSLFEGMKAYKREGEAPRLFRPDKNMARMNRSAARLGLPAFNSEALTSLIQTLVTIDKAWVPEAPTGVLYLRPTMIGTRPSLGVGVSDHCKLYVILTPGVGSMFGATGKEGLALLANTTDIRAFPGGTGQYKLGGNYGPTFVPQAKAQELGYTWNLWCFGERVTECGGSNFFAVVKEDGVTKLLTSPLNGEILPGVTRDSLLSLCRAHADGSFVVEGLPPTSEFVAEEREFTLTDLKRWSDEGNLKEALAVGTAVLVTPVGRIGIPQPDGSITDLIIPNPETGYGPIGTALLRAVEGIQRGTVVGPKGWSILCEEKA